MSTETTTTTADLAGELAEAYGAPATSGLCCGSGSAESATATVASTCCGTVAEAHEAGACCGAAAKADAVAAGAGCCG